MLRYSKLLRKNSAIPLIPDLGVIEMMGASGKPRLGTLANHMVCAAGQQHDSTWNT
jgi:hypothetical protein